MEALILLTFAWLAFFLSLILVTQVIYFIRDALTF